ncbi:MAG: hypothetical protein LBT53_06310 [Puniceicoccales bacterium]|jgi:Na+-transporting methylmalonyl-CoA/oxaloacetate decarboxylase gamma subunit|nr:hypothetical protein [Puniceicoccales bacterium]
MFNTALAAVAPGKFDILAEGIVGLFVVLIILGTLSALIAALSLLFKEKPKKPAPAAPQAAPASPVGGLDPNDPSVKVVLAAAAYAARDLAVAPSHLPVIAAAVAHELFCGRNLRLAPADTSWAGAGRAAIFGAHQPKA